MENREADIFDGALILEESHLQEGFEEGFRQGVHSGELEGRELGLKTGFQLGEELGFYNGCIQIFTMLIEKGGAFSERAKKSIQQLRELLRAYPTLEPEDPGLHDDLDVIRSKFRALMSMLSMRLSYTGLAPANDSTSF